jgi:thiamine-phosphate diphosphorylase
VVGPFASVTNSAPELRASRPSGAERVPIVHAVTNDEIVLRANFLERARQVMQAGGARVAVHVRAPRLGGRDLYHLASAIAQFQDETGAWAVVNDRADVALASGARGVQLTSRSLAVSDVAVFAPELWIGASVHSSQDALAAKAGGARWIVAGHATGDGTSGELDRGTAFIERLAADPGAAPIIAIGGVQPKDVSRLVAAGAHGVAVIRGVWNANDAGAAVIEYLSAYGTPGGR